MKKRLSIFFTLMLLSLFLTGCTDYSGELDEGNIPCKIALENIPDELLTLEKQSAEEIDIEVTVTNRVTRKYYRFNLTSENGYVQDATLNPGIYEVSTHIFVKPTFYDIQAASYQTDLEVGPDRTNYAGIYITNVSDLAQQIQNRIPSDEIIASDIFSRKVQWEGQIIDIEQVTQLAHFNNIDLVGAYEEASIGGKDYVSIKVVNETNQPARWQDCKLKSIYFSGSNAVFSKGVMTGTAFKDVVHSKTGAYGTPDSMKGSILLGAGMESMYAYYNDVYSGDKLTVITDTNGEYVKLIQYDFATFEY